MNKYLFRSVLIFLLAYFSQSPAIGAESKNDAFLEHLKKTVDTLSGREFQGRKTGTIGEVKTVEFLEAELDKIPGLETYKGFSSTYRVPFSFYNPDLSDDGTDLFLDSKQALLGRDFLPLINTGKAFDLEIKKAVIGACEEGFFNDPSLSDKLKGKALIFYEADCNINFMEKKWSILTLAKKAEALSPAAIFIVSSQNRLYRDETIWAKYVDPDLYRKWQDQGRDLEMALTGKRSFLFDDLSPLKVPAIYINGSVLKDLLFSAQSKEIPFEVLLNIKTVSSSLNGLNLVARLPGKNDQNVLISAHFDSHGIDKDGQYYPGADDNASGVALVLELLTEASEMAKNAPLSRGLVVCFYSGEEWGLIGSRSFAKKLDEMGLDGKIVAALNFDSISRGDEGTYFVLGNLANPDLYSFFEGFGPEKEGLTFSKRAEFAFQAGSDHYPLHMLGIPSLDITSGRTKEMDTVNDSMALVNLAKVNRLHEYLQAPIKELVFKENVGFEKSKKIYQPFPDPKTTFHDIDIKIAQQANQAMVTDFLSYNDRPAVLHLSGQASNMELWFSGDKIAFETTEIQKNGQRQIDIRPVYPENEGCLQIRYVLSSAPDSDLGGDNHMSAASPPGVIISEKGVYLDPSGYWYPRVDRSFEQFSIKVALPEQWSSITSGYKRETVSQSNAKIETWTVDYPSEPQYLIAGPYGIKERLYRGIRLQTYFYDDLDEYSEKYLTKLTSVVDLYLDRFGSYPYSKFAVVSNFFSTGYGMASFTLLDKNIIPFPFIADISLGHEFLHNYWGNSVYVKPGSGNWCEGLTVFMADYFYEVKKGVDFARTYRLNVLRDYQNLVNEENTFPLIKFGERYSAASRAIGYGKGMMFFYMLKHLAGKDVFEQTLREIWQENKFRYLGYDDFRIALEKNTGKDLSRYFTEWLERTDVPDIDTSMTKKSNNEISLILTQRTKDPYELSVPVRLDFTDGTYENRDILLNNAQQTENIYAEKEISSVQLDPDYEIMRTLLDAENPATLAMFLGQEKKQYLSFWSPEQAPPQIFEQTVSNLSDSAAQMGKIEYVKDGDLNIEASTMIFLSPMDFADDRIKNILANTVGLEVAEGKIKIANHGITENISLNDKIVVLGVKKQGKLVFLISAPNPSLLDLVGQKLIHYGKYSYLVFDLNGQKLMADTW